jgi:uncharacterized protein
MNKIIIFGGSGFIGKHLVNELKDDYDVIIISRRKRSVEATLDKSVTVARLRRRDISKLTELLNGAKAVINLAGENVGGRWTAKKMEKIRKSRLDVDSIIARVVRLVENKPEVVIQGSAIGIYGYTRNNIAITEEISVGQRGFLPKVAASHEEAFNQLESQTRVIYLRTGLVLDGKDGALAKIARQFKLYTGGRIGNGKQWNSWIHIDDEVRAIRFLIENENSQGAYNLTSPNPVTNHEFSKTLAKVLHKPYYFHVPSFVIRLFLGRMGDELLVCGLKVVPKKLIADGFEFKFKEIDEALKNIYSN